jgi:hypothetical protein
MMAAANDYAVRTEEILLRILRDGNIRTMDGLVEASGLEWSRVFLAIDRLSRSGDIALQRAGRVQYQVRILQENA